MLFIRSLHLLVLFCTTNIGWLHKNDICHGPIPTPFFFINFVSTSLLALLPGPLLTLSVYKICVHDEKMIHDTMVCIKTKPFNFFIAINFNSNTNIKRMTTVTTVLKCFIYVCV